MLNTQIASIINSVMIPNQFGGDPDHSYVTIAEDLRNVVDLGTALNALSASEFLDYTQKLAVGVVRTYFDGRRIGESSYGIEMDGQEYGGVIQRVKAKLRKMQDSHLLDPVSINDNPSAPSYVDGHFYGMSFDTKLYEKSVSGKVVNSISEEKTKKMFTTAQGVIDWFGFIDANVANTIENDLNQLAKAVIRKFILNASNGSRRINLIPAYNTMMNLTPGTDEDAITLTNWKASESFKLFCQEIIIRLKKGMREYNERYNDGSVPTFTPESDVRVLLLDEFGTAVDFTQSSVFHKELTDIGEYRTIGFWQNPSTALIENISTTSKSDKIVEVETDPTDPTKTVNTTVSYVVGCVYDKYTMGIVQRARYTSVENVGAEGFVNYHHHITRDYWVDPRNAGVILCLDAEPSN